MTTFKYGYDNLKTQELSETTNEHHTVQEMNARRKKTWSLKLKLGTGEVKEGTLELVTSAYNIIQGT